MMGEQHSWRICDGKEGSWVLFLLGHGVKRGKGLSWDRDKGGNEESVKRVINDIEVVGFSRKMKNSKMEEF